MRMNRKDTRLLVENWRRLINEGEEEISSIAKDLNFDKEEKLKLNTFVESYAGKKEVLKSVFGSDIGRKFYNFETFDGFKDGGSGGCTYAGGGTPWPTVTDLTGYPELIKDHEINYGDIKVKYKICIVDQPSGWSMSQNDELGTMGSSSYRLDLNASIGNTKVLGHREDKQNKESPRRMLILAQRVSVMQDKDGKQVEKLDKSEPMKNVCLVSVIYLDPDREK